MLQSLRRISRQICLNIFERHPHLPRGAVELPRGVAQRIQNKKKKRYPSFFAWYGKVRRSVFFPPQRLALRGFCLYLCPGLICLVAELVRDEIFKHLMFGVAIFSIRGEIRVFSR